jgi:hypothetical protein
MSDPAHDDDLQRNFEPLRVSLALGSLLVGLLLALH